MMKGISLFLLPCLFMGCSNVYTNVKCGLSAQYPGAGSVELDANAVREGLVHIFRAFEDSIPADTLEDLWRASLKNHTMPVNSSAEPLIANLSVALSILRHRGVLAYFMSPETYESVYAVSSLPVLVCVLMIHYKERKIDPIDIHELESNSMNLLGRYSGEIELHILGSIQKSEKAYTITTHDGIVWHGLPTDRLNGYLFQEKTKYRSGYCQIVGHLILSRLPYFEIAGHIRERLISLPYTFKIPEIKEFK